MGDILGNLATIFGGVGGMLVGFAILALVFAIAFIPFLFWLRNPDRRVRHTGLESFAASLDIPDEGYDDRLPPKFVPGAERPPTREIPAPGN